jgi:hypothetical protein
LSIAAADDALVDAAVGRTLAERYGGRSVCLPQRGHYALVAETGWQEVARSIASFLSEAVPVEGAAGDSGRSEAGSGKAPLGGDCAWLLLAWKNRRASALRNSAT